VSIEDIAAIKESRESEKEVLSQNSIDAIKKYEIDATLKLLDTGILIPEHVKLDNNKLINFLNNITGNCPEDSEV
jgi:hypothetical protein